MNSTSAIFNGTSRYSADFQQIIDRAVAIASLPMMQMESAKTALDDQAKALESLDARFAAVDSAIRSLESAAANNSYVLSNSDGGVVAASVSSGALTGVYTVEVVEAGSYTSSMSKDGLTAVADPSAESISLASTFTLTVAGETYEITPSGDTLTALAAAINAETEASVEATIVNIGGPSAPDYRLSLRSARLGAVSIQLNDGSADLVDTLASGTPASYRVNGQPSTAVSTDSRSVTVAPGLTVTLLKAGTANLTVSRNTAGISNALASFAGAYNAAVDEVDLHRGKDAGALKGNSVLFTLSQTLREIAGYSTGTDGIASLTSLGLAFDDQGKLSFDATAFSNAVAGNLSGLLSFLGSASESGFLQSATSAMDAVVGTTDGIVKAAIGSLQTQIAGQAGRISSEQDRIDQIEQGLRERMAAADALIAALERQVGYFTSLFESMRLARESRR